jgi:hypothetical protein
MRGRAQSVVSAHARASVGTAPEVQHGAQNLKAEEEKQVNRPARLPVVLMLVAAATLFASPPALLLAQESSAAGQPGTDEMQMGGPMMLQCKLLMKMEIRPTDPAALLALKADLGLSDEQTGVFETLSAESRAAAEKLLTGQQKQKLAALGRQPRTFMQMHMAMMQEMQKKMASMKQPRKPQPKAGMKTKRQQPAEGEMEAKMKAMQAEMEAMKAKMQAVKAKTQQSMQEKK